MRRFIAFVGLWAIALALLAVAAAWLLAARSLPGYEGEVTVAGLRAPVRILRTDHAVPHIFADSDADVFFGLGYAHAQDRMWQMEMMRRSAAGRLSEVLGPATLRTDELMRRMDLRGAAESSVSVQDDYTREVLESYAAGVNAFIETHRGWGRAAPEFLLFPVELEPWTPADSLATMKLLALQLASHVDREVLRARVSRMVPGDRLRDVLPDDPHGGIAAMPDYASLFPELPPEGPRRAGIAEPLFGVGGGWSSNAWSVGPSRSATGASLLANDPHLDISAPGFWFLARLSLEAGDVIGGTIPGIPVVLSGRTDRLAWGLTAANMDDQDVFIERLDPDDPTRVLTPDGFKELRRRSTTIEVRGADPVEIELEWSENGPIIPGSYYNLATVTPPGHVAAIARTLFDPADASISAGLRLMRAGSVAEALAAVEGFVTPAQNLSVVDAQHIALQMIGKIPRRVPGHQTGGRMPAPGWVEENRWHGYLPYADNPRFVDPPSGSLGNTNNKTLERPFPRHVSFDWGDTLRIHRLEELMARVERHDLASFEGIQNDVGSYPAETVLPLVLSALDPSNAAQSEAISLLSNWKGQMDADRPEPLIYAAFMRQLQHSLADDELGDLGAEFARPSLVFIDRVYGGTEGAAQWCDDVGTPEAEDCAQTAGAALDAALNWLRSTFGGELSDLRWGAAHIARHDHQVLGRIPGLRLLANIEHEASGGDHTLMRALTRGSGPTPFDDIHASGYRGVYDLSAPEASVFIAATGQSGHFLSRHYRDMNALWRVGGYLKMTTDVGEGAAAPTWTMTLAPASADAM